MLFSCVTYYSLDWTPINQSTLDYKSKLDENLSELYPKTVYRITENNNSQYLLYLEYNDHLNLYGYDCSETGRKPKISEGVLIAVPIEQIDEVEVKFNHFHRALIVIGGGAVLVTLSILLGIDLISTGDDD